MSNFQGNLDQQLKLDAIDDSEPIEDNIDETPYRNKGTRRVQTQPYDYAVRSLMDMVVDGDLILNPDYQRNYRWDDEKASRFIESLILNIPVPVVYLGEEPDTSLTVIDGQQRLSSLLRFTRPQELDILFKDDGVDIKPLVLTGLKVRADLNDKNFRELPITDRNALQKRHIRCICILNESDAALKYEVFERLNTGSVELTPQEIRNCTHRGPFNQLLLELAQNSNFQELIALSKKRQHTMKDAELILRFYSYRDLSPDYNENFTEYLNEYMEDHRNISAGLKHELSKIFTKTVDLIYKILGPGIAFRKPWDRDSPEDGRWTLTSINGAIYESQMINYSLLPPIDALNETQIGDIKKATLEVFSDEKYWESISYGTATKSRVIRRASILHAKFSEIVPTSPLKGAFGA